MWDTLSTIACFCPMQLSEGASLPADGGAALLRTASTHNNAEMLLILVSVPTAQH